MKYYNFDVVFQEIPDETTLAINISGCPCHCPGCHSPFLWEDKGTELSISEFESILQPVALDITCVCFMGGDANPAYINQLAEYTKEHYPYLKIGWYTGRDVISDCIDQKNFDYIKVGSNIHEHGGLNSYNTNQRMYKIRHLNSLNRKVDITKEFQNKKGVL